MKKFLAVFAVLAIVAISSAAMAEITMGGSYDIRSRAFDNLNMTKNTSAVDSGDARDTQNRIRIDVNAKAGDNLKGKLQLEHDFGSAFSDWGAHENYSTSSLPSSGTDRREGLGFREAWMQFDLPGIPVNIKAGHQLLQLGNGWFFRSQHYGTDAWVVTNVTGKNTIGFVNLKISEGQTYSATTTMTSNITSTNIASSDDVDAYVLLDVFKINDTNAVGIDITSIRDRRSALATPGSETDLMNLGLNYNGKVGPLALKAQVDIQSGKAKDVAPGVDSKFKGNQIVIEGSMPMDALTLKFWLGRGSGDDANSTSPDTKEMVTIMDIDPHYTFLYEYKTITAAGRRNSGFANTTALGLGAMFAASKNLSVGGNLWYLKATEKTNVAGNFGTNFAYGAPDDAIGYEIDLMLNWKLYDNLTWNWVAGYFAPGDVYKGTYTPTGQEAGTEATTGIQGILSYKF